MAWSTRQLAEIAGVSQRSIRHWHDIGLLPEPRRLSNNYKQYGGPHLVQALKIARLSRLGFSLERIRSMLGSADLGRIALRQLRDELVDRIAELEQLRTQADELIARDLAPELSPAVHQAIELLGSETADHDVAIVFAHLFSQEDTARVAEAVAEAPADFLRVTEDFAALPAESSEEDVNALAARVVEVAQAVIATRGDTFHPSNSRFPEQLVNDALVSVTLETLNAAQQRAMRIALTGLAHS